VAHGGQILVSQAMASLLRDRLPPDMTLRALGRVRLRDLSEPGFATCTIILRASTRTSEPHVWVEGPP